MYNVSEMKKVHKFLIILSLSKKENCFSDMFFTFPLLNDYWTLALCSTSLRITLEGDPRAHHEEVEVLRAPKNVYNSV